MKNVLKINGEEQLWPNRFHTGHIPLHPPLAGPRNFHEALPHSVDFLYFKSLIWLDTHTLYAPNHRLIFKKSSVKLDAGLLHNETHLVRSTWLVTMQQWNNSLYTWWRAVKIHIIISRWAKASYMYTQKPSWAKMIPLGQVCNPGGYGAISNVLLNASHHKLYWL